MEVKIRGINEGLLRDIFEDFIELKNYNSSLHFDTGDIDKFNRRKTQELFEYIPNKKAYVFGAFNQDRLVGFIWGYPRTFFDEERIFINSLVVHKEYEKKGIGRLLFDKIRQLAKEELNCDALDLTVNPTNTNAVEFYKYLGFEAERIQMRIKI